MAELMSSLPGDGLEYYPQHGDKIHIVLTENFPQDYLWETQIGLETYGPLSAHVLFGDGSGYPGIGIQFRYSGFQGQEMYLMDLTDSQAPVISSPPNPGRTFLEHYHIEEYGYGGGGADYTNWEDVFMRQKVEWVDADSGPNGIIWTYDILDYNRGNPAVIDPADYGNDLEVHYEITGFEGNRGFAWLPDAFDVSDASQYHVLSDVARAETGVAQYSTSPIDESQNPDGGGGGTDPA